MSSMPPGGLEDRYTVPLEANRRGAHRARPNPLTGTLPVVAVAVVVIAVIAGAFLLLGSGLLPSNSSGSNSSAGALPQSSNLPTGAVGATGSLPGSSISPTPPPATTQAQSSVKLVVLNATNTTGLAKKAAASLQAKGWTVLRTGNFTGSGVTKTTIFYPQAADAGTANQVATDLGVGTTNTTKQSSTIATSGITVVLGSDYHP